MLFDKIKGHPNLVRDKESRAIINTSKDELMQAKKIKESTMKKEKRFEVLENRLNNIESQLDLILKHIRG